MGVEPFSADESTVDGHDSDSPELRKQNRQAWTLMWCSIVVLVVAPWLWIFGPVVLVFGLVQLRHSRAGVPVRRLPIWIAVAIGSALCLLLVVGMVGVLWQGLLGGGLRGA